MSRIKVYAMEMGIDLSDPREPAHSAVQGSIEVSEQDLQVGGALFGLEQSITTLVDNKSALTPRELVHVERAVKRLSSLAKHLKKPF